MKETKTFTNTSSPRPYSSEAYTEDGGLTWRWVSNDSYCPLDACKEYNIPVDYEAQKAARDKQTALFVAAYRESYQGPSDEDRFEARDAMGEGAQMVNVLTGHRWKT